MISTNILGKDGDCTACILRRANAMIIKGMPILHARTYNVDFRTGILLVCPKPFNDSEAKFCYRVAQDSTIFRELSPPEGRTIIYGNGKYLVVGKTVVFNDLYESCGLTPKYIRVDNPKGRFAYGFAGAAFAIEDISEPFDFPKKTILEIYEHCIKDRWDETYGSSGVRESTLSDPIELEVEKLTCKDRSVDTRLQKRDVKIAIEDTAENRNNVIYCVQQRALRGEEISLCTSLETEKAITESCFDIVTCESANNVRLSTNTDGLPASSRLIRTETTFDNDLNRFNAPKVEQRKSHKIGGRTTSHIEKSSGNELSHVNTHEPHGSTSSAKDKILADSHFRKATSFTDEINKRSAPKINSDSGNETYRVNTNEPHGSTRSVQDQSPDDNRSRRATSFTDEISERSAPKINSDSGDSVVSTIMDIVSGKKKLTTAPSLNSSESEQSAYS